MELELVNKIFSLRGMNVMIDSDLAQLYGVKTKALNQAVKRNQKRFPDDFMFECNIDELEVLRSQFVTAKRLSHWNYKRRSSIMVFAENGVAMLSGILNSEQAIEVNIAIMRIFTKLRSFLYLEKQVNERISDLESSTHQIFKEVFQRLDQHARVLESYKIYKQKKIGFIK